MYCAVHPQIWEMVYAYYSVTTAVPALFPSMWFQFAEDSNGHSNLFYGFPTVRSPGEPFSVTFASLTVSIKAVSWMLWPCSTAHVVCCTGPAR